MSETVAEATAPTFKTPMQKMQFESINEMILAYNKDVGKINAAIGDKDALAESIANEHFAEQVEAIAKLQTELDALVDAKVAEALNVEQGDTTELQEAVKEQKSTIASGLSFYKKLYGDAAAEAFPKQERLKGVRVGGGGTGGRRIRGFNVDITDSDGAVEKFENFASAAKVLGMDTAKLQEFFFAKAGTEKLTDVPNEVEFRLDWEDEDEAGVKTPNHAVVKAYREVPLDETEGDEPEVEEEPTDEDETAPEDVVNF